MEAWEKTGRDAACGGESERTWHPLGGMPRQKICYVSNLPNVYVTPGAVGMSIPRTNPLRELHEQAEAEFQPYGDMEIVSTFGEPQAEYAAIGKGCGMMDLPQRGILSIKGTTRIDFLNRMITNELISRDGKKRFAAGDGIYSFLLNNKGRIAADFNVLELEDRTLLETDARNLPVLESTLKKYALGEKIEFATEVGKLHEIALHGPGAGDILKEIAPNCALPNPLGSTTATINSTDVLAWRDDICGVPGYFLILPAESARQFWMGILSKYAEGDIGKRRLRPVGWAVFNTARIEAGRALFGIDFDDSVLPAETGLLDRAVSFEKGCYLGQEIVARMHARGQVARKIAGIRMRGEQLPISGAPIVDAIADRGQNQIGGVTSSTISPVMSNAAICLGLMKSQSAIPGTEVKVAAEGAFRTGTVVELPFVKG
jgi:folate-binding protein YgfZ